MKGREYEMALLEVKNVKKIYTTRFGGNQVEAVVVKLFCNTTT